MAVETEKLPALGSTAPDFELCDSDGKLRCLSELAAAAPVVLVFYRGHW